MKKYILALDQGTTSSRAILFNKDQEIVFVSQKEFKQIYPKEGWVEHDPMEIFFTQHAVMNDVITKNGVDPNEIAAIGITNQRETTVMWDKNTGEPVYNAIVWQCRRTSSIIDGLIRDGMGDYIKKATGLVPDAYFSGSKIKWILDNVEGVRERAERGDILFGTIDSWLIWNLTNRKVHITDYTNASRTMLYNIHNMCWDRVLLDALNIPECILPEVKGSSCVYGTTQISGVEIPIAGIAGDQQAALFGQKCFKAGDVKNTYGTGCFMLMNTGEKAVESKNGLLTTIAASADGKVRYALEGSVFIGGAVIQWLRDEMKFFSESRDAEYFANKVENTGGVYLVPAFTGLGAPHWDMYARGMIIGITRSTTREHIIRAAQESIAYQTYDLLEAMEKDCGESVKALKVDGGASRDTFLMQFQTDILGTPLFRPKMTETTALGASLLAGLAVKFWKDESEILACESQTVFEPRMSTDEKNEKLHYWHKAVSRSMKWAEE